MGEIRAGVPLENPGDLPAKAGAAPPPAGQETPAMLPAAGTAATGSAANDTVTQAGRTRSPLGGVLAEPVPKGVSRKLTLNYLRSTRISKSSHTGGWFGFPSSAITLTL